MRCTLFLRRKMFLFIYFFVCNADVHRALCQWVCCLFCDRIANCEFRKKCVSCVCADSEGHPEKGQLFRQSNKLFTIYVKHRQIVRREFYGERQRNTIQIQVKMNVAKVIALTFNFERCQRWQIDHGGMTHKKWWRSALVPLRCGG